MNTIPCTFCSKYKQAHLECPKYNKCGSWCSCFTYTKDYAYVRASRIGLNIAVTSPEEIYRFFASDLEYPTSLSDYMALAQSSQESRRVAHKVVQKQLTKTIKQADYFARFRNKK